MTTSDAGIDAIFAEESFQPVPYPDPTPQQIKTNDPDPNYAVGYGTQVWKGKPVKDILKENPKFRVSKTEAVAEARKQIQRVYEPAVRGALTRPVTQNEFDSLVSIAYNRGTGAFKKDKNFLNKVNAGTATKEDFLSTFTNKSAGRALTRRRTKEYQLYATNASGPAPARSVNALNVPGASGASGGAAIVNAPSTTLVNNVQNGGTHTVVVPMNTRNPDVSLAAAQMRNVPMGG